MTDKTRRSGTTVHRDSPADSKLTAKDEAAEHLALALEEAHWARVRAENRTRPIGFHGENFERRAAVVEHIVQRFNERAVKKARKGALQAGWTPEELTAAGLAGDQNGSER